MTPEEILTNCKELYRQRNEGAAKPFWLSSPERNRIIQRCRSYAKLIPVNSTYPDPLASAQMILDAIATREGLEFHYADEVEGASRQWWKLDQNGNPVSHGGKYPYAKTSTKRQEKS